MSVPKAGVAVACTLLVSLGCGGSAAVSPAKIAQIQLEELHALYKTHIEKVKRPPTKLNQLDPWEPAYVNGYYAVNEGLVVVRWGQTLTPAAGAAPGVLAHEKDAPTQGGYVVLQDGAVRHMSATEFAAAPKAGKS